MTLLRRILDATRPAFPKFQGSSRLSARRSSARSLAPRVEGLETKELLSRASMLAALRAARFAPVAEVVPFTASSTGTHSISAASITQSTVTQTNVATVPDTLTNFTQPFAPPLGLFDPTLGRLVSVQVTATAGLTSVITSQNLSPNSPAVITGHVTGDFSITGLSPTGAPFNGMLSGSTTPTLVTANAGDPDFGGTSTVHFPPLTASQTANYTYTSPSDLAFFTASTGRTTITPVLVENANAGASAPNGNLQTLVQTSGNGSVSIVYNYERECPPVTKVVRYGIHHQPTQLYVTFAGPLNPADASNPNYYTIVAPNRRGSFTGPGTSQVPVASATYDAANYTVRLVTARPLNVHQQYQLRITLPCTDGNPTVIQFGGKNSLGGYQR